MIRRRGKNEKKEGLKKLTTTPPLSVRDGMRDDRAAVCRQVIGRQKRVLQVLTICIAFVLLDVAGSRADAQPINLFWGLSLGDSRFSVYARKGFTSGIITANCRGARIVQEMLSYADEGGFYRVILRNDKVWATLYISKGTNDTQAPPLGAWDATQSALESELGKPSRISISEDGAMRWVSFAPYHAAFLLEDDRVTTFAVYDPAQGEVEFCH